MIVNGKEKELSESLSLRAYLLEEGYNPDHIAVELDGEIIRKEHYADTMLTNSSRVEIVRFMGGG